MLPNKDNTFFMPQFDFYTYSNQTFWFYQGLLILFFIKFFICFPVSEVLKMRQKLLFVFKRKKEANKSMMFSFFRVLFSKP
jgi:hypothetical protein